MKQLLFKTLLLLFFLPTTFLGQSGEGYINYKSYKTHYGSGSSSTYNGVSYSGGANSTAEFDAMVDTNQPGTTLYASGEVPPYGTTGLRGGSAPRWSNDFYAVVYSGWFKPNKSGTYNIKTYADDSSETRYREVGTTTWQTMTYQWGCCSNVYGTATLDNTKWYEFEFRYQEYGGAAYYYFGYSIPANSSSPIYNWIDYQHEFGTWTNVEPNAAPTFTNNASDGKDAVYYKVFSTNGGDGNTGSHHPDNSSQFDDLFNTSTAGTTWTHQGRDTGTKALTWPWPNTLPRPNSGVWFGWEITGYFVPEETGTYEFKISSDDRSDFYLDLDDDGTFEAGTDEQVVYYYEGPSVYEKNVSLTKDTPVKFRVRYSQGSGGANLYLKWTKPSDTADNHTFNSDEIWSVKPEDVPLHYDVNYKFRNIDETGFKVNTYYEVSSSEIAQNSNSSAITLDANGEATITSQIDENQVGQGKYDITATPGSVEWVVIYSPMVTNKYRYSIGLDVREFPSGVDLDDVNNIELLDLVDTDGTSNYNGYDWNNEWAVQSNGSTWNNFYYYVYSPIPYSSSNYSSSIRDGGNYYALKTELNFTEVTAYKTQYVVFDSPTTTELETLIDDYFTVADVVMAFNELSGGGLFGGFKGDYDYNVQYTNSDLNRDGVFDFNDTQLMIDYLNGGTMFDVSSLAKVMMLTDLTSYESMTSTNWTGFTSSRTQFPLGLSTGTKTYDKSIAVHFKGDVNMSHSHLPSSTQTTSMAMDNMYIRNSAPMTSKSSDTIEVDLDIQKIEDEIVVTLNLPQNSKGVVGTEFRVGYDGDRVTFDRIESESTLQSFSAVRSSYIKLGSISTDGSQNLNGGTEYKIYFKEANDLTSFLGLVSVTKSELVGKSGEQIGVIVK